MDEPRPPEPPESRPPEPPESRPPEPPDAHRPTAAPAVPWLTPPPPPAGEPPQFTIRGVLGDTFARYGADPVRIAVVGILPVAVGVVGGLAIGTPVPSASELGRYVALTLALAVLSGLLGLTAAAVTFALLELGPRGALGAAIRWGLDTAGWLLVTALAFVGLVLATVIPLFLVIGLLAAVGGVAGGLLGVLGGFVLMLLVMWAFLRLSLAIPAVVADRLTAAAALRLSWRLTRPAGIWARILGALFLLGLLIAPAEFVGSSLVVLSPLQPVVGALISILVIVFLAPLATVFYYAAYRRAQPTRLAPEAATATPPTETLAAQPVATSPVAATPEGAAAPEAAASASFERPRIGAGGRAVLALTIVLAVVGVVSVPFTLGRMLAGQLGSFASSIGNVPVGQVVFGSSGSLRSCIVLGQTTTIAAGQPLVFMGHLPRFVTTSDEVRLQIAKDGVGYVDEVEPAGAYVCLGTERPETDIAPGRYDFVLSLNGQAAATGTLTVR